MHNRIITITAWACALAVLFYRRALVPLALLLLDSAFGLEGSFPHSYGLIHPWDYTTDTDALSNAELKKLLGIKGNRTRAELLRRFENRSHPLNPTTPPEPCTTPATPRTWKSSTAASPTSSAPAKTPTGGTTSPANSARSKR
jgi:hypothetical protein